MGSQLDYLRHIEHESALFSAEVGAAPADRPVPSCPDWSTADLIWHLAEVQWFWAAIVRDHLSDPDLVPTRPTRPDAVEDLRAFGVRCSAELMSALARAQPADAVWTWATEKSVAFVLRRQAHEALIHRVDAELVSRQRHPIDPALAADGVDEVLRIMHSPTRPWATVTPDREATVRIATTDTGDSWAVTLARFTGTDPEGTSYEDPVLVIADQDSGADTRASITGAAADLDCWLWNRPPVGAIEQHGDAAVLAGFETVITEGIE
ncbi:MAG: maleylpyruvate isomerase family mycothiol-dependent enzyme [Propionibacteriaceae bacterium]